MGKIDTAFAQNWIEEAKVFHQEVYEGEELMSAAEQYGYNFCAPPDEHPDRDLWARRTSHPQVIL